MELAIKYYNIAVDGGNANAAFNLGSIYENVKKDLDQAIKFYTKAESLGAKEAGSAIKRLTEKPQPSEKQPSSANSVEDVIKEADFKGAFYFKNNDFKNAYKHFLFAAENGNINSMSKIAILYEKGMV